MKAGPHATGICQPRQTRKGATVRRPSRVPWDPLAGAGFTRRSQDGVIDGGRWHHEVQVTGGVLAEEARALMQEFFRTRRAEGYRSGRTGLDSKSSWG